MNILQMNITYGIGSTGKIMSDLCGVINANNSQGYMVSGYSYKKHVPNLYCMSKFNQDIAIRKDLLISRITGEMGYTHKMATQKAIQWMESIHPDVIHLHNVHGNWINLQLLFSYLKDKSIPIVWTLHDCWPFTGRCSHFENVNCDKWKTRCYACNNLKIYPISYFYDKSEKMYFDKKEWFTAINNMTIVTPSKWLAANVTNSFLGKYSVETIASGVDRDVFYPRNIRSKYIKNVSRKKAIILGVAQSWNERKGLYDFYKLDRIISHEKYQIVLVGLNQKQLRELPNTIIGISRIGNRDELAELYSSADCYLNCSKMETMGMTTVEAMACGTPVVVFNETAVPETVGKNTGLVLRDYSAESIYDAVIAMCKAKQSATEACVQHVKNNYDKINQFEKYCALYRKLLTIE